MDFKKDLPPTEFLECVAFRAVLLQCEIKREVLWKRHFLLLSKVTVGWECFTKFAVSLNEIGAGKDTSSAPQSSGCVFWTPLYSLQSGLEAQ